MADSYEIFGTGVSVSPGKPASIPKKYVMAFVSILSSIALFAMAKLAWNRVSEETPGDQSVEVL